MEPTPNIQDNILNWTIKDYIIIIISSALWIKTASKPQNRGANGRYATSEVLEKQWAAHLLVWLASVLGPLELNFQPLCPDLEPIHGLNGTLSRERIVVAHEPEALAKICMFVDEHLGADDAAKRLEHLDQVHVLHIVREVVDEQIAAFRTWDFIIITSFENDIIT